MAQTGKKDGLFFYLFLLTVFLLLLEISFFIQCNKFYLSDFKLVAEKLVFPSKILPGIFFFVTAQLAIHLAFCIFTWLVAAWSAKALNLNSSKTVRLGISVWMLGLLTVLTANHYYYPNSKFTALTYLFLPTQTVAQVVLSVLLSIYSVFVVLALYQWMKSNMGKGIAFICLIVAAAFHWQHDPLPLLNITGTPSQPNIIIIGIDSVRPDFLGFFGRDVETPFMDNFLNRATVFSEAVTPLARTFPSWVTILTGEYPRQNGVRHDLATQSSINQLRTLPKLLQTVGYQTIFATDEVRFSNIDENFGFDNIISPPMGLNDFLIGTFNDFPLSNLIVNTKVGAWLFPHSYGNRPVHFTYHPDSFLRLIQPILATPKNKPVFLAIHFCLPHTPYLWCERCSRNANALEHYKDCIQRLDKQVADFYALLSTYRLLDHAIVILLSDHGEGLELPGDRLTEAELYQWPVKTINAKERVIPQFYPPVLDHEGINQSAGHGTDVLGLTQYHAVLAFQALGVPIKQAQRIVNGTVSFIDIQSTLLDLLGMNGRKTMGVSLVAQITGNKKRAESDRHIFLESDFSPEAIRTVYPDTRKVLLEGIQLFQIDPVTTRLFVKPTMADMIVNSKQYADIYREWMLALYPQNEKYRMPILINLVTGEWTNDLTSPFALKSPANEMLIALKLFYGNEINAVQMCDKATHAV